VAVAQCNSKLANGASYFWFLETLRVYSMALVHLQCSSSTKIRMAWQMQSNNNVHAMCKQQQTTTLVHTNFWAGFNNRAYASSSSFKQHQLQIAYSETNDTQAITIQTNKT